MRWSIPMSSSKNYFECEIISKRETGCGIWIGIGPLSDDYEKNVVSYRLSNGHVHYGNICKNQDCKRDIVRLNLTYSEGDRIGCCIDFDVEYHQDCVDIFFTKNGVQVSDHIKCEKPKFLLGPGPVVGMMEVGEKIRFLHCSYRPSLLSVSRTEFSVHPYNYTKIIVVCACVREGGDRKRFDPS